MQLSAPLTVDVGQCDCRLRRLVSRRTADGIATTRDTTAPTVSLTAPADGATVSGTVTLSATATDNVGVAGVQFKLDGTNLGAEDTSSPYSVSWNTTTVSQRQPHADRAGPRRRRQHHTSTR